MKEHGAICEVVAWLRALVACAVRSILPEETAARRFIAWKVWPDANDVEASGSVRKKSCERGFPHRGVHETGMVEKCPCPPRQAMNHAVMAIMLLSVAIQRLRPVLGREELVSEPLRTILPERQPRCWPQ